MEISEVTKKYWREEDWKDLEKAESMDDMYLIAKRVMYRMPLPLGQVCGPVATGGFGLIEKNLEFFNENIKKLQAKGLNIFDQMPFEGKMQFFKKKFSDEKIIKEITGNFYLPLFKDGKVSTFYFLPNWQTSFGAKWEHEKAEELGIKIVYLD